METKRRLYSLLQQKAALRDRRLYAEAEGSLFAFVRQAWAVVEPATPFLDNWHIRYLCEWLECITFGLTPTPECCASLSIPAEPVHALVINIPPRYMKSLIVTVMWPVWEWIARPHLRYLFSSYSSALSTSHSLARRRILESPWYQRGLTEHWGGGFTLVGDQNVKTHYENSRRGQMLATSTGGTATGQGGDRVVIDDPLNPLEAASDAKRISANRHFDETLSTRLNDKRAGAFVLVMQRLHQRDLTGHVLDEGGWVHLRIPGIAERPERIVFPRSGEVVTRETGSLLWPEREGEKEIARVKKRLGSYGFAGQYQQTPTPPEGGTIKRGWFRYWTRKLMPDDDPARVVLLPTDLRDHLQSWDTTLWDAKTSDYCVAQVWARKGANAFLLDQMRKRLDLPATKAELRRMTAAWPEARRKLIERTANGSEIVRRMGDEIPGIVPIRVSGSKEARAVAVTPFIEAGNVFLPHPREAGWVADLIEECASFPFGEHDDQVDAMTQALSDYGRATTASAGAGSGGMLTASIGGPDGASGLWPQEG